ncbi:PH-interacting protein-like isoform X2 [Adelges cooleyi]|uniref:PH-interacting protein-like isoform X2 n=1 Tax=Adelges cooleyi TaxID=133065 RepID=UPI00217F6E47|nr:PH-interacting protein-like isoform X2 [Adelges cooleyi]
MIKTPTAVEVPALCRQLQQNYKNSEEENKKNGNTNYNRPRKLRPRSLRERSRRECNQLFDWKAECKKFLQIMWMSKDSTPFREPVDYTKYPNYGWVVNTPIDFTSIWEDLRGDNYNSPVEFCEDVRRVFENSRLYTEVHPDQTVESMRQNMIDMVELNITKILNDWNTMSKCSKTSSLANHLSSQPQRRCRLKRRRTYDNSPSEDNSDDDFNNQLPKRLRQTETPTLLRQYSSRTCKSIYRCNDSSDSDDVMPTRPSRSRRLPMKKEIFEIPPITSKRQTTRFHDENYNDKQLQPQASSSRGAVKPAHSRFMNLRTKQKRDYAERSEKSSGDSTNDEEENIRVSVSSRGRIRKLTADAKAMYRR